MPWVAPLPTVTRLGHLTSCCGTDTGAGKIAAEDKAHAAEDKLAEVQREMAEVLAMNSQLEETVKAAKGAFADVLQKLQTAVEGKESVEADLKDAKADLERCQLMGS